MTGVQVPYEHPQTLVPRLVWKLLRLSQARLLDIGGGSGIVGVPNWPSLFELHVLDIFPYERPPECATFHCGSGLDAERLFGAKTFDIVQMFEVIEHVEKADGGLLLDVAERVARKLVIGSTPYGFCEQDPEKVPGEAWAINPHQKHVSGWLPDEFESRGYRTLGNGGDPGQIIYYKVL